MSWRLAESLKKLREQINAAYPGRDTASDGAIGDAAHASRSSDHNPWVKDAKGQGVVTAIDIDEDLSAAIHSVQFMVDAIIASRDSRVKYIIYEGRMCSSYPASGHKAWTWRPYSGKNPHQHHAHISVNSDPKHYDSRAEWNIGTKTVSAEPAGDPAKTVNSDNADKGEQTATINPNSTPIAEPAQPTLEEEKTPDPAPTVAEWAEGERPPAAADEVAPAVGVQSENTTIMATVDNAGDKWKAIQATLEKFGISDPNAARSKGTVLMTIVKWILSVVFIVAAFIKENWEYLVMAAFLIGLAVFLWNRSGKRVADAKAGVPVKVLEETK